VLGCAITASIAAESIDISRRSFGEGGLYAIGELTDGDFRFFAATERYPFLPTIAFFPPPFLRPPP